MTTTTSPERTTADGVLETDVLVIGSGPAGASAALFLSTYGVDHIVITKYRWTANTPRAHITNQRTVEIFRDMGIEDDVKAQAMPQRLMGDTVFCTSLAGDEIGRIRTWGTHPRRQADYTMASPSENCDLPQTLLEPMLVGHAAARGSRIRFDTEYVRLVQDDTGVTVTVRDRLSGTSTTSGPGTCSEPTAAAAASPRTSDLPFEGEMDVAGSMNIVFHADLSRFVEHRPSVLYWVLQPGSNIGGIGMGLVRTGPAVGRVARRLGLRHQRAAARGGRRDGHPHRARPGGRRQRAGDDPLDVACGATTRCTQRATAAAGCSAWATPCTGTRRPTAWGRTPRCRTPTTSPGSSPWSCAGRPAKDCSTPTTPSARPVGKQIVLRANKSIEEFGPIFETLGFTSTLTPR
jgi:2,4-dichlorophenol 6-monooxygenase